MFQYRWTSLTTLASICLAVGSIAGSEPGSITDWRSFEAGDQIYTSGYIDQPYVVVLNDATWLCVFTTGAGKEGAGGQHIVASRSADQGKSWSRPVDIEPADGPPASWAMPYLTRYGRVYVFYDYNGDRVDRLRDKRVRNDMLGWYCFKFSDDGGRSWSDRHRLPVRVTACDRGNDWKGDVQIFWGIDKADTVGTGMMFGFTKLGKYMLDLGEGWFFRCDNINIERDPNKLQWTMLPDGDHGLRHPDFGSIQEEHNLVPMGDGSLYCVYRTCLGYPAESYSRDGGKTWSTPRRMRYADDTLIKTPRACPRLFRCGNGKYLFWFHNHSGTGFDDRNPAWLAGGIERNGRMLWSQPEIVIYSHDTSRQTGRFSYPDLIEQDGRYWVTCTNKETGRVHQIPPDLLEGLWGQLSGRTASPLPTPVGSWGAVELAKGKVDVGTGGQPPARLVLDSTRTLGGLTIDMSVRFQDFQRGAVLFDARDTESHGVQIAATGERQLEVVLTTGGKTARWATDLGSLAGDQSHRVTVVIDDGPNIIMWIVDGRVCDGGTHRQYGWTRYDRELGRIQVPAVIHTPSASLLGLQIFDRPLRTSDVIALQRSPAPTPGE